MGYVLSGGGRLAGVEDNNYLPRTPAEGRKREGLDGRPTMGDDG